MATPGRRPCPFGLDSLPLARTGLNPPKVVIVVECPLLRGGEFSSEEVHPARVSAPAPCMAASWERAIRAGDLPPLAFIDEIDVKVIEETGGLPIEVLAAKQEELVAVRRRPKNRCGRSCGRSIRCDLRDFEKLSLLVMVRHCALHGLDAIHIAWV